MTIFNSPHFNEFRQGKKDKEMKSREMPFWAAVRKRNVYYLVWLIHKAKQSGRQAATSQPARHAYRPGRQPAESERQRRREREKLAEGLACQLARQPEGQAILASYMVMVSCQPLSPA